MFVFINFEFKSEGRSKAIYPPENSTKIKKLSHSTFNKKFLSDKYYKKKFLDEWIFGVNGIRQSHTQSWELSYKQENLPPNTFSIEYLQQQVQAGLYFRVQYIALDRSKTETFIEKL